VTRDPAEDGVGDDRERRGADVGDETGERGPSGPPRPATRETEDERFLETVPEPKKEDRYATLQVDAWRVFRIMGEFVEGFEELAMVGPAVSFFGSARVTAGDPMYQRCVETARLMGEAGFCVITGGGPGIMEAANRGARQAGVYSVGCNIELPFEQESNGFLDLDIEFRYFFVRKTMFVKYAEAFVIFPGGFGTMDELFEALTLIQTGKIRDFPVVLFGTEYWGGLMDWIRSRVLEEGKVGPDDVDLIFLTDSPAEAVEHVSRRYRRHHRLDRNDASG